LAIAAGMLLLGASEPGESYVSAVLPGVVVFGLGLSATVAPVTATALGSVPDRRSGAASGTNNAMARTGQLLTVAAIPSFVGLGGDALSDADRLSASFPAAMAMGAALVAAGAVLGALFLEAPEPGRAGRDHPTHCPIDGPVPTSPGLGLSDATS
jgi:hypothetical protein